MKLFWTSNTALNALQWLCLPYTSCRPSACFHELCSVMCSAGACYWCELWPDLCATVGTKFPLIFPRHTLYRVIKGPWLLSLWCTCFSLWFSSLVTQHPYSPHPFMRDINLLSCSSFWFPSASSGLEHRGRWKEAPCKGRHNPWRQQEFSKDEAASRQFPGTDWKWCVRGRCGCVHPDEDSHERHPPQQGNM